MDAAVGESGVTRKLLERAAEGDRSAVNTLFDRHRDYLRQVIDIRLEKAIRTRVDPSDIVQETHVESVRRLDDFLERRPIAFRAWLRQIAHERLIMARRRHLNARRGVHFEMPLPDTSSIMLVERLPLQKACPTEEVERRELARQMRQAIAELDEIDRDVLYMRYLEDLSNKEIGFVLDMDANTVCKRHGRALLKLRRILIERGWLEGTS